MYAVALALDDLTVLNQAGATPFDIDPMPLLTLLNEILLDEDLAWLLSETALDVYQLKTVPHRIPNQVILVHFETSGEIEIMERKDRRRLRIVELIIEKLQGTIERLGV
jgi:hypothetical protein